MIRKLSFMMMSALLVSSSFALEPSKIAYEFGSDYFTEDEYHCMALNIYHEARNEPLSGKVAVADVVLNRVYDIRYPNAICDVVEQAVLSKWHLKQGREVPVRNMCQFSWFCDGLSDKPREGISWENSKLIAKNFLTYGEYRGITEGATHYHATYVDPSWASSEGMHMIGQIGEHIFYRWK